MLKHWNIMNFSKQNDVSCKVLNVIIWSEGHSPEQRFHKHSIGKMFSLDRKTSCKIMAVKLKPMLKQHVHLMI